MKKILLTLFMCVSFNNYAQEFNLEPKTITGVFEAQKEKTNLKYFQKLISGYLSIIILQKM